MPRKDKTVVGTYLKLVTKAILKVEAERRKITVSRFISNILEKVARRLVKKEAINEDNKRDTSKDVL